MARGFEPHPFNNNGWSIDDDSPRPESVVLDIRPEGYVSEGHDSEFEDEVYVPPPIRRRLELSRSEGGTSPWGGASPQGGASPGASPRRGGTPVRWALENLRPQDSLGEETLDGKEKEFNFEIALEREEEELGVDVLRDEETLLISRIYFGLVQTWNQTYPDKNVHPGDRIVGVNGLHGDAGVLIDAIRGGKSLRMGIRRVLEFAVVVQKADPLGLEVAQHSHSLRILLVDAGPFHEWNLTKPMDLQVQNGDLVVEVNGLRGTAAELLQAIKSSEECLEVVFRHSGSSRRRAKLATTALAASFLATSENEEMR